MYLLVLIGLILMPLIGFYLSRRRNDVPDDYIINNMESVGENTLDRRHRKGDIGENEVANDLSLLDDEYRVIHNALFNLKNDITIQVDHIVIGRNGIYVLETKNYGGIVEENKWGKWTQIWHRSKFDFYSPVHQNESHIKSLMYVLFTKNRHWFQSAIVFPNRTILHTQRGTPAVHVKDLCNFIESNENHILTTEQVNEIYEKLIARNIYSKQTLKQHRKRVNNKY